MEDARVWVRWWRLEGLAQVRELLWELWDPLGLADDAPDDGYDTYAHSSAASSNAAMARTTSPSLGSNALAERDARAISRGLRALRS
jgi:hypothetical protein